MGEIKVAKRCIIWGNGQTYEKYINQIHFEESKANIEVVAIICRAEDCYCDTRDGYSVICKEELKTIQFDYIIIASESYYNEIYQTAIQLGIEKEKIINGKVFTLPLFDFKRYINLVENPVTILSDDCWGGYVYHRLSLPFSSPLINIFWEKEEFAKFMQDPIFYLNSELTMVRESNLRAGIPPLGQLGREDKTVQLILNHNINFAEAKEQWDRRKKRININNLFIKFSFESSDEQREKYLKDFENIPYNKVLFYNGDTTIKQVMNTERYIWRNKVTNRVNYYSYANFMRTSYFWEMDTLKLLNGERDYSREGYKI